MLLASVVSSHEKEVFFGHFIFIAFLWRLNGHSFPTESYRAPTVITNETENAAFVYTFFSQDIFTCHCMKSTDIVNDIDDGHLSVFANIE